MGGLVWQQIKNAGWGKGEEISQMTDVWGKMISDVWLSFCSPINRDKWAQTSEHSQSFSPSWAASWNDLIISLIVAIKKTSRSCQYFGDSFGMNDPKIKKHSSAHMIVNLCVKKKKKKIIYALQQRFICNVRHSGEGGGFQSCKASPHLLPITQTNTPPTTFLCYERFVRCLCGLFSFVICGAKV